MYNKLKPEFKVRWVEALRSGKYDQGRTCLKSKYGAYCCIGVAAEISGCDLEAYHNPEHLAALDYSSDLNGIVTRMGGDSYPPSSISNEWLLEPVQYNQDPLPVLAFMNDHEGKDFNHIAKWIEENL